MKNIFLVFLLTIPALAFGQFGLGNPNRTMTTLGVQTTARGIVYYAATPPNTVITWRVNRDTAAYMWVDTTTSRRYEWNHTGDYWATQGVISAASAPSATFTNGPAVVDNRDAFWRSTANNKFYFYDRTNLTWAEFGSGGGGGGCGDCPVTVAGPIIGDGTTTDPLNFKGYYAAADGKFPVKDSGTGIEWVSESQYLDTFTIVSNTLRASISGDSMPFKSVNLAPYLDNTDAQTLSFVNPNLSISGGNSVNLSGLDTDTDEQTLSLAGQALSISGGNSVNLPVVGVSAGTGVSVSSLSGVVTVTNAGDTNAADDLTTSTSFSGDVSGLYNNLQLGAGVVGSTEIATDAVTAAKIVADAVGSSEIAANAVGASELASTTVTAASYGSATQVPTYTVDPDGRLTAAANVSISVSSSAVSDFTEAAQDAALGAVSAGTGVSVNYNDAGNILTVTNTAPDQTVSLTGAGINSISGTYPSFTITGTEVDGSTTNEIQNLAWNGSNGELGISAGNTVDLDGRYLQAETDGSLTNEGVLGVSAGTGTTAVITSNTSGANGVTVEVSTGLSVSESANSNGGSITLTNTAPDQTVSLTNGGGVAVSGTYPSFTLTATDQSATNEIQNLSLTGQSLGISSGTGVTLPVVGITAGSGISATPSAGNYTITNTGDTDASNDITTSTTAGGDLSGTYPNPTVDGLQGVAVSATSPTTGQVLKYNGTAWAPADESGGGGGAVASVTGSSVDNTDPANPVVNAIPMDNTSLGLTGYGGDFRWRTSPNDDNREAGVRFDAIVNIETGAFQGGPGAFCWYSGSDAAATRNFFQANTDDNSWLFGTVESGSFNSYVQTSSGALIFHSKRLAGTIGEQSISLYNQLGNENMLFSNDFGGYDFQTTKGGVTLPRLTTTQRDALSPSAGWTIYCTDCTANDSSTGVIQTYNGSAWKNHW